MCIRDSVVAEDDEARWLVGEQPVGKGTQQRSGSAPRRLSAVGDDEELPLGEDAIGMVAEVPPAPAEAPAATTAEEPTEDLSATAAAVRGTGDADWIATQASERPAPVELGRESDADVAEPDEPTDASDASDASEAPESTEAPADEPGTPRRTAKKKSRASVPSWDEIMFGGGKRE